MRHLYIKIYLAFLLIMAVVAILAPLSWWLFDQNPKEKRIYDTLSKLAAKAVPPIDVPLTVQQQEIDALAVDLNLRLTLYDAQNQHIVSSDEPLPPSQKRRISDRQFTRGFDPMIYLLLPDKRSLIIARRNHEHSYVPLLMLFSAFIIFSLGIYLLAKRLTGRLERLRTAVDRLGEGDMGVRVAVEGKDEIAELAKRFNHAAERIEQLVHAQKNLLATASHELRTPLTRMHMALNLFMENPKPELERELTKNIQELDHLIDEVLLASKLDTIDQLQHIETVDLLGLLAEEAIHYQVDISGESAMVEGDAYLLRRLIRNLLENARRYGGEIPPEFSVKQQDSMVILTACDRGSGVPESERTHIFDAFYRPQYIPEGAHGGAGLGLSLVKQIAEQHQGSVACHPRHGGGTCFEVRLSGHWVNSNQNT